MIVRGRIFVPEPSIPRHDTLVPCFSPSRFFFVSVPPYKREMLHLQAVAAKNRQGKLQYLFC